MTKTNIIVTGVLCAAFIQGKAQLLPLDPAVHTGKLPNGFTYYIRHNETPENRVTFYLVNKVGSIQEDEDQRGLAHFLEHMNFNGTRHYPKNQLVEYLQKSGVRFGADLNAYTNFNETVYQLPLPSDDTFLVRHGLQIMRDWAGEATLDQPEIDKERGVVLEEKRLRSGAQQRMSDQYLTMQLNHSRYAERLPIGTEKVLNNFKRPTLERFYRDWYRPNLQALIVVGDVDVQQIEQQVKQLFSDLRNPGKQREHINYTIQLSGKNQFMALTDKEQPSTQVQIIIKQPEEPLKTKEDYRATVTRELLNYVLSERLRELITQAKPPFVKAQAGMGGFMGGLSAFSAAVTPIPGQLQTGIEAIWTEVIRMKTFGPDPQELERAKTYYLRHYLNAYKEKDKTPSGNLVEEYVQHFLKGTTAPGIESEYKLVQELLPQITKETIHDYARRVIMDKDRDILILAPEKEKAALPAEAAVNGWLAQVQSSGLTPWQDTFKAEGLLKTMPMAGRVIKRTYADSINVTTLLLSNGVKVLLKSTDFKNEEILFTAFAEGGSSLYPDSLFLSASNAGLIAANGVGGLSPVNLSKLLAGKAIQVQPFIHERYAGISGGATPADLETCMQLVYLYFTAPRKDPGVFNGMISRSKSQLAGKNNSPEAVFADSVTAILGMQNYRRMPITAERLDSINLDKMYAVYKEQLSNANGFTFVFAGSFDTSRLIPLITQYIGALPAAGQPQKARDLGIHIPEGKISKTFYLGSGNKANVNLIYSGAYVYNEQKNMQLSALGAVLQYRMTERIREAEGGAYTPQAGVSYNKLPEARYAFSIRFTCAPANVEKLIAAANEEIVRLKANGPAADDIGKFKAERTRNLEVQRQNNQFWLQYLAVRMQNGEPLASLSHEEERLHAVSPASVQQAAKDYLKEDNYIRLVMMMEEKK